MDCIKRVLKDYLFPWFVFINNMKYEKSVKTTTQKLHNVLFCIEMGYVEASLKRH